MKIDQDRNVYSTDKTCILYLEKNANLLSAFHVATVLIFGSLK